MPDDGSGSKKVWRIEDMELVEVGEEQVNFLYNGDCYVIQYSYGNENIVYFWQGANCSIDERGASALHAARIDNEELGGDAMQVGINKIMCSHNRNVCFVIGQSGSGHGAKTLYQDVWRQDGRPQWRQGLRVQELY